MNVSKNWLKSLNGIENCEMLEEFYGSYNYITQLDDLNGLQNCKELQVIDLLKNPIQSDKELNKFLTFHFSNMEVSQY